jgi:hypothetical protein
MLEPNTAPAPLLEDVATEPSLPKTCTIVAVAVGYEESKTLIYYACCPRFSFKLVVLCRRVICKQYWHMYGGGYT